MRFLAPVFLLVLAPLANADRLISTPLGRKIPYRAIKLEAMSEVSRGRTQEYFVGLGIGTSFDMEIRSWRQDGQGAVGTFDLGYNIIAPVPGLSPGISLGVQDALDKTQDGRRGYGAVTFRPVFTTLNGEFPAEVTLGAYFGSHGSAFVGLSLPFSQEFRFLAEHNGLRLASGVEIRPSRVLAMRMIFRDRDVLSSLVFTKRF